MLKNFKTNYNFKVYDPLVHFAYLNTEHYDAFMPVVFSLIVYFSFVSNFLMLFVNSNTETRTFWYYFVVINQDNYVFNQKSPKQVQNIFNKKILFIRPKTKF